MVARRQAGEDKLTVGEGAEQRSSPSGREVNGGGGAHHRGEPSGGQRVHCQGEMPWRRLRRALRRQGGQR